MSEAKRDYIEVDLSQEKPDPYVGKSTEVDSFEKLSFPEKVVDCEKRLDDAIEEYNHGSFPKESNVTNAFLWKEVNELKEKYLTLISEAPEKEFNWWLNESVDRLLCGCLNNVENENPRESERLMEFFKLYRTAKNRRDSKL